MQNHPKRPSLRLPGLLARGAGETRLKSRAFDALPDPCFVVDPQGRLLDANEPGKRLFDELPEEGAKGALGKAELRAIFGRAVGRRLGPSALRVDGSAEPRFYEARIADDREGHAVLLLSDVSIWKRALAEKEALISAIASEREKPVPVCASCGALKKPDGSWGLPGGADAVGVKPERRSHGLCHRCLEAAMEKTGKLG